MKRISLISVLPALALVTNLAAKTNLETHGVVQSSFFGGSQKEKYNKKCKYIDVIGSVVFTASAHNPILKSTFAANVDLSVDMSTAPQKLPVFNSVNVSATGPFGKIQLGNIFTAACSHYIDGSTLMGGDSGVFGVGFMNMHNAAAYAPVTTGVFYDPGYASAVSYESPSFHGLQFAISYTPNSQSLGLMPPNDEVNREDYGLEINDGQDGGLHKVSNDTILRRTIKDGSKNPFTGATVSEETTDYADTIDLMAYGKGGFTTDVVTAALYYNGGVPHHWNYSASLAYWTGKANFAQKFLDHTFKIKKLNAFAVGAKIGFKHIKIGFGYVDEGQSCLPEKRSDLEHFEDYREPTATEYTIMTNQAGFGDGANAGKKYTAVLSYLLSNKIKLSLGGMYGFRKMSRAKSDKVSTKAGSFAIDWFVMPGVTVYLGATHAQTETCERAIKIAKASETTARFGNNKITYITIGSKVTF